MLRRVIGKAAHDAFKSLGTDATAVAPCVLKSVTSRAVPFEAALSRYPGLADLLDKDVDPKSVERALLFTISDESRDRDNDRIKVGGWKISEYRKNPVVLWMHDHRSPPIARGLAVFQEQAASGPRLRMVKQFTSAEENPFGAMIFNLCAQGYLRAASVGFLPRKWERDPELAENDYGLLYSKQDLLESSVVTVPSNPAALADARAFGIDLAPYKPVLERALDGDLEIPFVSQQDAEAAYLAIFPVKVIMAASSIAKDGEVSLEDVAPSLVEVTAQGTAIHVDPVKSASVSDHPQLISTPAPKAEDPVFTADPADLWTDEHIKTLSAALARELAK